MKVIVYKNKEDDSIFMIESIDKYIENGHSEKEIEDAISKYESPYTYVYLHEVAECDEEIIKVCATNSTMLFADKILHSCYEEIPCNTYIYVFNKHKGHNMPSVHIMKVGAEGVKLPEIHGEQGVLPIAWCRAKDLVDVLGMTKRNITNLTRDAETLAWAWYKG